LENYDRAVRLFHRLGKRPKTRLSKVISNTQPDPECRIKIANALSSCDFELRDHSNSPGFYRKKYSEDRIAAAGFAKYGRDE
jgi:hypothetical protein